MRDPSHLRAYELRSLAHEIEVRKCRFRRITESLYKKLARRREEAIAAGLLEPDPIQKKRSDAGDVRGCHLHPDTRTKTRVEGKLINTPPYVDSEDDDIESVSEWETVSTDDSDPIED